MTTRLNIPRRIRAARQFELEVLMDMLTTARGNDRVVLLEKIEYLKNRFGVGVKNYETFKTTKEYE